MKWLILSMLSLCLLVLSCSPSEERLFVALEESYTGVDFKNQLVESRDLNILTYLYYYNGGGVAAADFNGDGLHDLYFTSNQGPDKFYINLGDLKFKDVTQEAGINNDSGWTTGVTHVDINDDGLLDIYVCKVGNFKSLKGENLLYINQGVAENGNPTFKEDAAKYGLNISGFSTQASFFDYDLDGDLDCFLMRHSVFPNRNYGKGKRREQFDPRAGDLLFRNDAGKFTEVGQNNGIYQGITGYGLGLGVSDLNNDGYPDIYVGNDFFENDYLYINQQDGSFKEIISQDDSKLGHTTHYSMGNDLADINNDGLIDIVSTDMLPEDLKTYKTSSLEYPYPIYQNYLRNGYSPQYMQNTFHLNLGGHTFSEIAHLSGIAATEWSWAPLLADFDNDGYKDLFVSNGIKGATNDMDFINFIANEEIQKQLNLEMTEKEMSFINKMPEKKVANYFFRNTDGMRFENVSDLWTKAEPSFSQGSVYADLDNDGDLDLVINNTDAPATIYENTLKRNDSLNYLKVNFKGIQGNQYGIGTKVKLFHNKNVYVQENFNTRGYLSAIPPELHFGLGSIEILDSLHVIWPGGAYQSLKGVTANQGILLDQNNSSGNYHKENTVVTPWLAVSEIEIPFSHRDNTPIEFNRDPLVPFTNSNEGPSISIADVNQDGKEDIFIGGGKGQAASLLLQVKDTLFNPVQEELFKKASLSEDIDHVFFSANEDPYPDLLVVSGGNEFKEGPNLQPRLYMNNNGVFSFDPTAFEGVGVNASRVKALDFDHDGDDDILITSDQVPHYFGETPRQYLFENRNGSFVDVTKRTAPALMEVGQVNDVLWVDIDGDGNEELILAGPWMTITILNFDGKQFEIVESTGLEDTSGWWESLASADMDGDGDLDIIAGNWGQNSKFRASIDEPITLYWSDFDDNGTYDPVVTYYHMGKETPFASKDELSKQMPFLNREFLSYKKFAEADLEELFSSKALRNAEKKQLYTLASIYIENKGGGKFSWSELPPAAQVTPITDLYLEDFNKDGYPDMLAVGNRHEISTQLGRLDASHGLLLQNEKNGGLSWIKGALPDIPGQARNIARINIGNQSHLIVTRNNNTPIVLQLTSYEDESNR